MSKKSLHEENLHLKQQLAECNIVNVLKELYQQVEGIAYFDDYDEKVVELEELKDLFWLYIEDFGG